MQAFQLAGVLVCKCALVLSTIYQSPDIHPVAVLLSVYPPLLGHLLARVDPDILAPGLAAAAGGHHPSPGQQGHHDWVIRR